MTHYADCASFISARVLEHQPIADSTFRIRLEAPAIASSAVPGQFVMLRLEPCNDPLIARALAIYDCVRDGSGNPYAIDLVYLVKGKFTQTLSRRRDWDRVSVWGPLGNSFSISPVEHLVLVAGGVGQTPMLMLGKEALGIEGYGIPARSGRYADRVTLCYGARTAARLAGVDDFLAAGFDLRLATDDGSMGGGPRLVTELLTELLDDPARAADIRIACCGPEPMMEAVSQLAHHRTVPCEVSLETPMACGIGICFTCVAKIRQSDGQWDYQRTCVEGPIFPSEKIVW